MADNIEERIKKYKSSLETAKIKIASLQGSVGTLTHRLKEELGISSIEEARKRKETIAAEKAEIHGKILQLSQEIEKSYDFGF